MFETSDFSKLPEFGIGHATSIEDGTGVTVIIPKGGATASCEILGGGPATRETDLLNPEKMIQKVHAVCLCGGSAMGLEAACGVARHLQSKKIGFKCGPAYIPIVPAASIFDLRYSNSIFPDVEMGITACKNALENLEKNEEVQTGCVGVGTGATVGMKGLLKKPMKSGFGMSCLSLGKLQVAAATVVNSLGNVVGENQSFLAGLDDENAYKNLFKAVNLKAKVSNPQNTTLSVVMTNANITKTACKKVAQVAHDGFARAIFPVHLQLDGDSIFVLASSKYKADTDAISTMAAKAVELSIRNAVESATDLLGMKGLSS